VDKAVSLRVGLVYDEGFDVRRVGVCARQRTHFSCFAKKSKQKKASRIRRPCGHAALLGLGGVWLELAFGSNNRQPSSAQTCANRLLITAPAKQPKTNTELRPR